MSRGYVEQRHVSIYRQQLIDKFVRENSPCLGTCPGRRQNCHATCEAGKKFAAAFENFKTGLLPELIAAARNTNKQGVTRI